MKIFDTILNTVSDIKNALEELNQPSFQRVVSNIKAGSFKRESESRDYQDRLIYTRAFRKFAYNPAILNEIFSCAELKKSFFRTFGYKGALDFTIYPNCWLRDLPMLDIGSKTYLADGILLGTNQVSTDQKVLKVGTIKIGERCVFDQDCKVGYNSVIGDDCIIGIQTSIGLKCKMGNNVKLGEACTVRHGVSFGNDVIVGGETQIGNFCIIEDGVVIEEFSTIPSFSLVTKGGIFSRKALRKTA
jgi:carbonic anhydrase/acetyltransferase-like protein (isoleucine patch superfamily)